MSAPGEGADFNVPELPANPRVLGRLLASLDDSSASSAYLARVIQTDPALTLAVLRAVLAGTGFPDPSHGFSMVGCVDALGRDLLQAFVLLRSTRQVAAGLTEATPAALADTWRHALLCAELGAALARAAGEGEADCYLAGLLCDVGALARLRAGGKPAPLDELEWDGGETTLSVLADAEGAWIGRGWLPPFVADALRLRREPPELLADAPFAVRALKLALVLADEGASEPALALAKHLVGLDEQQTQRAYETALTAARELPVGREGVRPALAGPDLLAGTWEEAVAAPPARGRDVWGDLGQAVGEAGFRRMLYQALATAGRSTEVLERLRRAWRLLTPLEEHYFFMADAQGKTLTGTPLAGDLPQLAQLTVRPEASRSLLGSCARDKRLTQAFGGAINEQGSALDRVLLRALGADGLLCVPLADGDRLQGVVVFGLTAPWSQDDAAQNALLARLAGCAGSALAGAEQARLQQERMRSALTAQFQALGRRVVHEAGNPLSIVKNYLKVLGNKLGDGGQFRDELAILNEELDRVGRIVQQMGKPLTPEAGEHARTDLNATVREVMTLATDALAAGRGIEVHQQLDARIPALQADPGGLKQVMLNLVTNAIEAMGSGGRLMILTADNVSLSGEAFVLLQVTDTGSGIGPEAMRRLFQPGFSTKGDGHEGIGLAVSESIVRAMGGRILCRSSEGRGTIFMVLLPRLLANGKSTPPSATAEGGMATGDAR